MKIRKICGVFLAALLLLPKGLAAQAEEGWPQGPAIEGEAAVVMEVSTGTVLYEANPHERLYPASITKIMTALLAVENCSLDEEVTFSREAVFNIERDSTHISRDVGEKMTMEQCLYAVILSSANDCAYAVGEHTGKGYENFIKMMNDKAAELGCTDTNFMNPHGLHDDNHYTSAYDMALIARAAIQNETFRTITGTKRYTIPTTNKHPNEETPLVNQHRMLNAYQGDTSQLYEYCIGGKNGYTDISRNTLVTYAEKDDMMLVCVVLKEDRNSQYRDTRMLLDYCFDNFRTWNVSENVPESELGFEGAGFANTKIFGTTRSFADLDSGDCIVLPTSASFTDAKYELKKLAESDATASLEYTYAGRVVGSVDIRATNVAVEPYPFHDQTGENLMEKLEDTIQIRYVLIAAGGILGLIVFGFLIRYLASNFYILRHKYTFRRKKKSRFKEIKSGKHTKWKTRW